MWRRRVETVLRRLCLLKSLSLHRSFDEGVPIFLRCPLCLKCHGSHGCRPQAKISSTPLWICESRRGSEGKE